MTYQEFINKHSIKTSFRETSCNPYIMDDDFKGRHYNSSITYMDQSAVFPFSVGAAIDNPQTTCLLECLKWDCGSVQNTEDFEDWADQVGFDPDSRKAEKIYNECKKQMGILQRLLGESVFNELMECEDDD